MLDKVLSLYCDKVVIERGGGIGIGLRIRIPLYNIVAHGQRQCSEFLVLNRNGLEQPSQPPQSCA